MPNVDFDGRELLFTVYHPIVSLIDPFYYLDISNTPSLTLEVHQPLIQGGWRPATDFFE